MTLATAAVAWVFGLGAVLSFGPLKSWAPLGFLPIYEGKTVFDILDFTVANVLIPTGALLITVFAGWAISSASAREELAIERTAYTLWRFAVRIVAPVGVLLIAYANAG